MSIEKAIEKALSELDSLGESAIRRNILGLDREEKVDEDEKSEENDALSPEDEAALLDALSK